LHAGLILEGIMIAFENELIVPGDLEEVRERVWQGQPLPGHNDFYVNLVERVDETTFLLYVKEKIYIHELGYHVLSEITAPNQVTWTQIDHKRFIERVLRWNLEPVEDGVKISYRFEAKVVGGEVGETITRKMLLDVSKQHLDRLLHEFQGQMAWVVEESKKPPAVID